MTLAALSEQHALCCSIVYYCSFYAGKATISNDGATIMKLLDIVHPAAKTLVEIAKSQDAEVSDGHPTLLPGSSFGRWEISINTVHKQYFLHMALTKYYLALQLQHIRCIFVIFMKHSWSLKLLF